MKRDVRGFFALFYTVLFKQSIVLKLSLIKVPDNINSTIIKTQVKYNKMKNM